ncbi:MAG: ERCC4 domain-containing protein [Candidatus Norongarragalinales archaeon]
MVELNFEQSGRVKVFADDREKGTGACSEIERLGGVISFSRLPVGDFVVSDRVCVERKTAGDFESSIIDGRLFSQAQELKENFASPLFVVVGRSFERLHANAVRGALVSLAVDYKIPVFFAETEVELGGLVFALGFKEQLQQKHEIKVQFSKKGLSLAQQQRLVVESLPMIGPKNALALLQHFGSVEKIVCASEKELRGVKGIGRKRAKQIRAVLGFKFE